MSQNDVNQRTESGVTPSEAMIPPTAEENTRKRSYKTQNEPLICHARMWADADAGTVSLMYNGVNIVTFKLPEGAHPHPKAHSDGNMQSSPFIQQFTISCDETVHAQIEFESPVEMRNMRARRAASGEAILGQLGNPLIYGANAMYFVDWDLLVSLHGLRTKWLGKSIRQDETGWHAAMELELGTRPLVVLIRPRYYGQHLGYSQHEPWKFKPNPKPVAGWCSWEAYHSDVTEENVREAAQAVSSLKKYGLEYMQLDDGYQQLQVPLRPGADVGDSWLNTNEKFPGGHAAITDAMKSGGFKSGIWTNATLTNREAADASGCCVRREDGTLLKGDWIQYVLDCAPATLARHVTPYYRALREQGYEYFKSDSLRHLIYDGQQEAVRLGLLDNETASARQSAYMRAAREGIGPDAYYLSCWGMLSQSVGVADAMRIAGDTNPHWCSYSMQLRESARWYFAQRVMFTVDPDVVCVRGKREYVRMMLSLVSLMGGLYMISDAPETYGEEQLELIRRTLPPLDTCAAETGPVDYTTPACMYTYRDAEDCCHDISHIDDEVSPFSSLWAFHINRGGRSWCVAQRAAVVPLDEAVFSGEALGIDPEREYYAYDFWAQSGKRVSGKAIAFPKLELGDTTVLALTEIEEGRPVLVGSSRHVSMDAVSVRQAYCGEDGYVLELVGFDGLDAEYAVFAGELKGEAACAEGASAECARDGELIRVKVKFAAETARIVIR